MNFAFPLVLRVFGINLYIKKQNIKIYIAIKPNTKVTELYPILKYVHLVLIMTVEPGKGGQKLILETLNKIK